MHVGERRQAAVIAGDIRFAAPHLSTTINSDSPHITVHDSSRSDALEDAILVVDINPRAADTAQLAGAYSAAALPHWWFTDTGGGITALTLNANAGYTVTYCLQTRHLVWLLAQKMLTPVSGPKSDYQP